MSTCASARLTVAPVASRRQASSTTAPAASRPLASSAFKAGAAPAFFGSSAHLRSAAPRGSVSSRAPRQVTTCAAKVVGMIKLAIDAGKANPAPPIGPALGAKGVNIMAFCKEYNARTADKAGTVIPVEITVFEDKSFTFILKTPPAAELLKKAAGIAKGAPNGKQGDVATITQDQLREIAAIKLPDLNANDIEAAMKVVGGTASNMGIKIAA